jgi:hypothetical protein
MVLTLLRGLSGKFRHMVSILKMHRLFPTFAEARTHLLQEEMEIDARPPSPPAALVVAPRPAANTGGPTAPHYGAPTPPARPHGAPSGGQQGAPTGGQRSGRRRGRGGRGGQQQQQQHPAAGAPPGFSHASPGVHPSFAHP